MRLAVGNYFFLALLLATGCRRSIDCRTVTQEFEHGRMIGPVCDRAGKCWVLTLIYNGNDRTRGT